MAATISDRLSKLPISSIRKLSPLAQEAKAKGRRIYHLNIGDPDIKTPPPVLSALKKFPHNPIRYAESRGETKLLDALLQYYHKHQYNFVEKEDIIVTMGGSEACIYAFFAVAQPGDEILTFEPYYSNYASCAAFTNVTLSTIPTTLEQGFHLPDAKTIEKYITKKTKAILFCSPSNPTGAVYTKDEIKMLVHIAKKHTLFLLSDEVYREFSYTNIPATSLLGFMQAIPQQAIVLDSLSKRYSLCGARVGIFLSRNVNLMQGVLRLATSRLSAGLIDQIIAAELTHVPNTWIQEVVHEYKKRRDILYEGLRQIPGVHLPKPEGAFYTMVTLPVDDAEKFAIFLLRDFHLNNETVMLAPGSGFYNESEKGKKQVRIAYVLEEQALKKSITIIEKALYAYQK